jgi:hypothetical protein
MEVGGQMAVLGEEQSTANGNDKRGEQNSEPEQSPDYLLDTLVTCVPQHDMRSIPSRRCHSPPVTPL